MYLSHLSLQNFRSYPRSEFDFSKGTTFIIGPNTSGKTNLLEAIFLLSFGRSFRTEKEIEMIRFGEEIGRVKGAVLESELEVVITTGQVLGKETPLKKYLLNGVSKRRMDFVGNFVAVLFSPLDLDIVVGSPFLRRNFLDGVLEAVDREYRLSLVEYTKALRQRNALLEIAKNTGERNLRQFEYWDTVLIQNGNVLTQKREKFIDLVNTCQKDIFDCVLFYDKSIISKERLLQYQEGELGAGVTLVGPHRDDFSIHMYNNTRQTTHDVKLFGSRGQQRLAMLQLKLLELLFIEKNRPGVRPVLLLDDIFSELDSDHIQLVVEICGNQQTMITTTHQEFVPKKMLGTKNVIDLSKRESLLAIK